MPESPGAPDPPERLPEALPADPFPVFEAWLDAAERWRVAPNPNAMALATVDPDGRPAARIVLCKFVGAAEGRITFFTNYASDKGRELEAHPVASALFHWDSLERQARLTGPVVRSPEDESDAYFATRPWMARIGAWASEQSRPIGSRAELLARLEETMRRFGLDPANPPPPDAAVDIPRPPHWGGFRLWAQRVELWTGGAARLHDRAVWQRDLAPAPGGRFIPGPWTSTRLQP